MTVEVKYKDIPQAMIPLYEGSARKILAEAKKMLTEKDFNGQKELLANPMFHIAVTSALDNTDQRRSEEGEKLVSCFDEELKQLARVYFSPAITIDY